MAWASIDPGSTGTGVCVWPTMFIGSKIIPIETYALKYNSRSKYMFAIENIIKKHHITKVVCENATYFQGSVRGESCLTSGKLIKLAQFIGSLEEVCRQNNVLIELVIPQEWKGQLPKRVCLQRLLRIWSDCPKKPDHVSDAVGIGYWKLGKF